MNEAELQQILDSACKDPELYFQVIQQPPYLYIYINREETTSLDLEAVSEVIRQAIASIHPPEIQFLALYSRMMGATEPDWESTIALYPPQTPATNRDSDRGEVSVGQPEAPETDAVAEAEYIPAELNLAQYCFTRNKLLLTSQIKAAPETIARLVMAFEELTAENKTHILPQLESYFRESTLPQLDSFSPESRAWFESVLDLDMGQARKLGTWMSRYCSNPDKTIAELAGVLNTADAEVPAAEEPKQPEATQTQETVGSTKASYKPSIPPATRATLSTSTSGKAKSKAANKNTPTRANLLKGFPASLLEATFLGGIVLAWGLIDRTPIRTVGSHVTMVVTLALLFRPCFGDFSGFCKCLLFFITPDIFSLFRGKYIEDVISELKLIVWLACGFVTSFLIYSLLGPTTIPQ